MTDRIRFSQKFAACLTLSLLLMGTFLLVGTPPRPIRIGTPLSIADLPMSQLDGETLTWYYFGHSHVFGCIIGLIQIMGAFLLFFRRTRFAGALLLLPVMLNILLINVFYQMNAGALLQSILLTLGVLYFLFQEYPALIRILFAARPASSGKKRLRQWMAPIAITYLWPL